MFVFLFQIHAPAKKSGTRDQLRSVKIRHGCVEDFQVRRLGRSAVLRDDVQAGALGRVQLMIVGGIDVLH